MPCGSLCKQGKAKRVRTGEAGNETDQKYFSACIFWRGNEKKSEEEKLKREEVRMKKVWTN